MYFEQEAKIKAASDIIERRQAELNAILNQWDNPPPIPALGTNQTITSRDILKRNWPELAAVIKAAAIRRTA